MAHSKIGRDVKDLCIVPGLWWVFSIKIYSSNTSLMRWYHSQMYKIIIFLSGIQNAEWIWWLAFFTFIFCCNFNTCVALHCPKIALFLLLMFIFSWIRAMTLILFNSSMRCSITHPLARLEGNCLYNVTDDISFCLIPLSHLNAEYTRSGSNAFNLASQAWWIWKYTNPKGVIMHCKS